MSWRPWRLVIFSVRNGRPLATLFMIVTGPLMVLLVLGVQEHGQQVAVVAQVWRDAAQDGVAYERFQQSCLARTVAAGERDHRRSRSRRVLAVVGAIAGYVALWTIYWLFKLVRGKEGMGYGDFKLLAALGALLISEKLRVQKRQD